MRALCSGPNPVSALAVVNGKYMHVSSTNPSSAARSTKKLLGCPTSFVIGTPCSATRINAGWQVNPSPRERGVGRGDRSSSGGDPSAPAAHTTIFASTRYSPAGHSDGRPLAPAGGSLTRTVSERSGAIRTTSARVTTSTPPRSAAGSCTRLVPCFAWLGQPRLHRDEPLQPFTFAGNCSTAYPAFWAPASNRRLLSLSSSAGRRWTLFSPR